MLILKKDHSRELVAICWLVMLTSYRLDAVSANEVLYKVISDPLEKVVINV